MSRFLKKVLTVVLSVMMLAVFMPTSTFATAQDNAPAKNAKQEQIGKYFEPAADDESKLADEATLDEAAFRNYEDGKVLVNKEIKPTDQENVFDINLTVKTSEVIKEQKTVEPAAAVIVIDCSGSMATNEKMTKALDAARQFVDKFKSDKVQRDVAVVSFSGWAKHKINGAHIEKGWTTVTSSTNSETIIPNLTAEGGTNLEAGMMLASNLIKKTNLKNKNVILISDGKPTYSVKDNSLYNEDSTTICSEGGNMLGDGNNAWCEQHEPVETVVSGIDATKYAIYVGVEGQTDSMGDQIEKKRWDKKAGKWVVDQAGHKEGCPALGKDCPVWLNDCGFKTFTTTDADALSALFEIILKSITKAEAWTVTDPMGENIEFQKFNRLANPAGVEKFECKDGTITWDIRTAQPSMIESTEDGQGNIYTYNLPYRVTLKNLADGFVSEKYYKANGPTSVEYLITEEDDTLTSGVAYFNVPTVKGLAGNLNFTKKNNNGEVLEGAKFKLTTTDDSSWKMEATSTADGSVKFENIPSGHEYTLTETFAPEGYIKVEPQTVKVNYGDVTVGGKAVPADMTVIDTPNKTSVKAKKVWNDSNNNDGKRASYTFTLYKTVGSKVVEVENSAVTVSGDDALKNENVIEWNNLPKVDANEQAIKYWVAETSVPEGYTSDHAGKDNCLAIPATGIATITNTHTPEKISIDVEKEWDDNENDGDTRPDSITVRLLKNGKEAAVQEIEPDATGNWAYTFENLDKYANGQEIKYTITEDEVENYATSIDGFKILNSYVPPVHHYKQGEVTITKKVTDANDKAKKVTGSFYVSVFDEEGELLEIEGVPAIAELKLDDASQVEATIEKIPLGKYTLAETDKDGNKVGADFAYEVSFEPKAEFEVVDAETGNEFSFVLTNKEPAPETTSVSGEKTWADGDDQDGIRPDEITVRLMNGNKEVAHQTVTEEDNWAYTFEDLPKYEDKELIDYTVKEDAVEGYETKVDGYDITNTHVPEKTKVDVQKEWANDSEATRPDSITVRLLKNGEEAAVQEIKPDAQGNWAYTFDNLDKYAKGKEIKYTITEDEVSGYETSIDGYKILNTFVKPEPEKTSVHVTKEWLSDNGNEGDTRPDSITVRLLKDGTEAAVQEIKPDAQGNWEYTFEDLDKYDGDREIVYEVSEDKVSGYITSYDGYNIINTLKTPPQEYKEGKVTITKKVVDSDDVAKEVEDSFYVTIFDEDGAIYKTVEIKLNKESEGKAVVEHIPLGKYTVAETDASGKLVDDGFEYDASFDKDTGFEVKDEDGAVVEFDFTLTNKAKKIVPPPEPEKTSVHVTKEWMQDYDNDGGTRPDSIKVRLYKNGTEIDAMDITPDAEGNWEGTFENLDKYENGQLIEYTISEDAVKGYTTVIEGFDITNTLTTPPPHKYEDGSLTITKKVLDKSGNPKKVSDSFYVTLFNDGVKYKTVEVKLDNASEGKSAELTGIPFGTYTLQETDKDGNPVGDSFGYEASFSQSSFTVTRDAGEFEITLTNTEKDNVPPTDPDDPDKDNNAKTGDQTNLMLPLMLMLAAMMAAGVVLFTRRRDN